MLNNLNGFYTFIVQEPQLYKNIAFLTDELSFPLSCFTIKDSEIRLCFSEIQGSIKKLEEIIESNLEKKSKSESLYYSGVVDIFIKNVKALIVILEEFEKEFVDHDNCYTKIDGRKRYKFIEIIFKNELTY